MRYVIGFLAVVLLITASTCSSPGGGQAGGGPPPSAAAPAGSGGGGNGGDNGGGDNNGGGGNNGGGNNGGGNNGGNGGGGPATNNDVLIGVAFGGEKSYSFGSTNPRSTVTRTLSVGARTAGRTITVKSVSVTSKSNAFRIKANNCKNARFPGPPCTVTIAATPPDTKEHTGSLVVTVSGGPGATRSLVVAGSLARPRLPGGDKKITPGDQRLEPSR